MSRRMLHIALAIFTVVTLAACGSDQTLQTQLGSEVKVPDGYSFADASSAGDTLAIQTTVYCTQNGTGRVFVCTNGKVGAELIIEDGYTFAGVSESGNVAISQKTYYCRQNSTGKVFICKPK
jgi:hypothetical protein